MSTALASAWMPRGETNRFEKLLPILLEVYSGLTITLPPAQEVLLPEFVKNEVRVRFYHTQDWSEGRWLALKFALDFSTDTVHYVDFDRLLRWVEIYPTEWKAIVAKLASVDYLLIGRSASAYQSHPRALVETERISNRLVSALIEQRVDISAGSKGFSRRAAEYILQSCLPGHALGTDGEWTVTLYLAGFNVEYVEVDGLDWESADRYQESAASSEQQKLAAQMYDQEVEHWKRRVEVADEVVEWALKAWKHMERDQQGQPCKKV